MHSTRGWERRKLRSAGPTSPAAERSEGAHRIDPRCPDLRQAAASTPRAGRPSARRTYGKQAAAQPVSRIERARTKSEPPSSSSQREDARADGRLADASATAARLKLPSRATRSKATSWSTVIEDLDTNHAWDALEAYTQPALPSLHDPARHDSRCSSDRPQSTNPIVAGNRHLLRDRSAGPIEMERRVRATLEMTPWLVEESEGSVQGYAYASKHRERAGVPLVGGRRRLRARRSSPARASGAPSTRRCSPCSGCRASHAAQRRHHAAERRQRGAPRERRFRPVGIYPASQRDAGVRGVEALQPEQGEQRRVEERPMPVRRRSPCT